MFGLFAALPSTRAYEQKEVLHETLYARFHDIKKSQDFKRYEELKTYVRSPEYEKELRTIRSLSYKTSKEYLDEQRWKELRKYKEVKQFIKSGVESDSKYVQEYITIEDKITSPSFRQRKAYLQNKKRHLDSDPYLKFKEYQRLSKSEFVKTYYKLEKKYAGVFAEMERWTTIFTDEFDNATLNSCWNTSPQSAATSLAQNYSHSSEEHALTDGKNIQITGNVVQLTIKKQTAAGVAWNEKMGFIPREFSYTSGMLSSSPQFEVPYGRLIAKICCPNVKNIYSAFWLSSDRADTAISVAHYCNKQLLMGAFQAEKKLSLWKKLTLQTNSFYIFQLDRTPQKLTWSINGKKMYECANPISEPLYLFLTAGVIGATHDESLPASLEVDYIRLLQLKEQAK